MRLDRHPRRRVVATGAALALATGGLTAAMAVPAHAAVACDVDFAAGEWNDGNGGFTASVTITNLEDPISGWTMELTLPGSAQLTHGWSADWAQDGQDLTAGNLDWNGNLGPGDQTTIGFNGTAYAGDPDEFTLNGVVCDGSPGNGNEAPSVSLTSPSSGAEFTEGSAVPLAAEASDPDGSVDRVEFYVDGNVVGTDSTAPYSASATGLAVGSHSAQAVAYDDGDPELSGESATVPFSVAGAGGAPSILADPGSLTVDEGGSGEVTFSLSEEPSGSVDVALDASGDPGISVAPATLTFDGGNWSSGLAATVSAAQDGDQDNGTATLTASAVGYDGATVAVTAIDDDQDPGEGRVDNPYLGADVYVNPDWSAAAQSGGAPPEVYDQPTGVWLDRIAAIESGSAGENVTGLADHLDNAVAQDAANGSTPLVFQVVIYNLPGRDCAALASNGELGPEEIDRYKTEYIDVITEIMGRPEYSDLRKVAIIEIDSLPNLVTNTGGQAGSTELCDTMLANGNYVEGVGYATAELAGIGAYNYIDAAHHGWIGWDSNFNPTADVICEAANAGGASPSDVHGMITNTANYSALEEPFIDTFGTAPDGQLIRQSDWVDWNQYNAELPFAQDFRQELVNVCDGVDPDIGMLIDTSRNGWGGPDRPDGPSQATELNQFVDESRIDQRIHKGNWCNQAGAGLGERPQAAPESGIDAYVWIKPPGESDGSSEFIDNDEGKGFDEMCDPDYQGNERNGNNPSGALPDAPLSGHWFQAQFDELMANAWPTLE